VRRLIHVSPVDLAVGATLNTFNLAGRVPGWAELRTQVTQPTELLKLVEPVPLIEAIYENVRDQEFPDKPTRLTCAFACGRPESAMYFALRYRNRDVRFYDIEPIGTAWVADMALINPGVGYNLPIQQAIQALIALARRYWTSVSTDLESDLELPEVIPPQSGRVTRKLEPPFLR
jgi:hypothetical protein